MRKTLFLILSALALNQVGAAIGRGNQVEKPRMVRYVKSYQNGHKVKVRRRLDKFSKGNSSPFPSAAPTGGKGGQGQAYPLPPLPPPPPPPPEDENIFQQTQNSTMMTEMCKEATSGNETSTTISYRYSLETTTDELDDIEEKLKSDMFVFLSSNTCSSSRRLSVIVESFKESVESTKLIKNSDDSQSHRRRLELIEMGSSAKDLISGSCTPEESMNNTCAEYDGEILAIINDVGDNSNEEEITNSIMIHLNYYAENTNFTSIDANIVKMKILTEDSQENETKIEEVFITDPQTETPTEASNKDDPVDDPIDDPIEEEPIKDIPTKNTPIKDTPIRDIPNKDDPNKDAQTMSKPRTSTEEVKTKKTNTAAIAGSIVAAVVVVFGGVFAYTYNKKKDS